MRSRSQWGKTHLPDSAVTARCARNADPRKKHPECSAGVRTGFGTVVKADFVLITFIHPAERVGECGDRKTKGN